MPISRRRPGKPLDRDSRKLLDAALADREAFGEIIDHTKSMVYAVAYGFFRNRLIAEDLAQDAYLALFRNLHKLESDMHLVNWLRQTVTRKCIDYSRRKKNRPHLALDSIPERHVGPVERDPIMAGKLALQVHELALEMAEHAMVLARATEDSREGPRAFAEKRAPVFQGR